MEAHHPTCLQLSGWWLITAQLQLSTGSTTKGPNTGGCRFPSLPEAKKSASGVRSGPHAPLTQSRDLEVLNPPGVGAPGEFSFLYHCPLPVGIRSQSQGARKVGGVSESNKDLLRGLKEIGEAPNLTPLAPARQTEPLALAPRKRSL